MLMKLRDERPPQSSSPSATPANNGQKWRPPSSLKRPIQSQNDRNDDIFRKVRGILNKLTPEKFDKLGLELLNVGIDSEIVLRGIILLIFEKALDEPKYSSLYAQLCHRLCEDAPNFEPNSLGSKTFTRLLLTKCQDEFENRAKATAAFEKDGPLSAYEEEQFTIAKAKMLGNIKFIGELGKLDMVHESILHKCIKQLLNKKKRGTLADLAEDLECLCQIIQTGGRRLDHDRARAWMDQYFTRMEAHRRNLELPSRIRFMLQDVAELRSCNWVPRKIARDNAPRTIQQVHHEAAKDMGHYNHHGGHNNHVGIMPGFQQNLDLFGRPMNGFSGPPRPTVGPMSDMFGPGPTSPPAMGGIGTGPGVIPMDHPFSYGGRGRGRGYQGGQFNSRGGGGENNKFNKYDNQNRGSGVKEPERSKMRNHDDSSDEEERPGSGGSGGRGGYNNNYQNRGGIYQNRGGNRGGYNNYNNQGQNQYNANNRNPNYQGNNYNPNYQQQQQNGDQDESGYGPPGGGRGGYFEPRGGRGGGGGYFDDGRGRGGGGRGGGYTPQYNNPASVDTGGGHYNKPMHTQGYNPMATQQAYAPSRGGYHQSEGGGFRQSESGGFRGIPPKDPQQAQKDLEKLPPRFRKQLELQHKGPEPGGGGSPTERPPDRSYSPGPPSPPTLSDRPTGPPPGSQTGQQPFFPFDNGPPMNGSMGRMNSPVHLRLGSSDSPPPPMLPPPQQYTRSPSKHEQEISLRPVRMPAFRPNIPNMLPKSAQGPPPPMRNMSPQYEVDLTPKINTMGPPPTNLTIKSVPAPAKKRSVSASQDELKQATDKMLKDFLENGYDLGEAVKAVKELKAPKKYLPELVTFLVLRSLDQSDTDRENVGKLLHSLNTEGIVESQQFMEGVRAVLEQMKSLEADVPLVKSYVSRFAACAVTGGVISLSQLAGPLHNGRHYPLFLLCLQQVHKMKDREWLVKAFNDSRLDLQKMLPECDQNKERMLEILDDRGLRFMFPLLHIQSDLWRQISADPNPSAIYRWIKDNCSAELFTDHKFINIVFANVLRYITSQSTMKEGFDPDEDPSKADIIKEKELLTKFKGMLASYIHTTIDLQVIAIYAIQAFCHGNKSPKGLLLRLFICMYDLEVIDEQAFLKWKEDLNDDYPGKGKALFQVNQWLIWLEQAESESSDDE